MRFQNIQILSNGLCVPGHPFAKPERSNCCVTQIENIPDDVSIQDVLDKFKSISFFPQPDYLDWKLLADKRKGQVVLLRNYNLPNDPWIDGARRIERK